MSKAIKLLVIGAIMALLFGCGSKKNPTGGPVDTVKPEVLATLPQEFGQIADKIEITFSKPMDKSSFLEGLYFYPPIAAKKLNYSGRTLSIQINEKPQNNTNYYLTLSTRIKDTRGNSIAKVRSFVFGSGRLNDLRLSGGIEYEEAADHGKPLNIELYSADSLLVRSHTASGSSYGIEALNPARYILRAFQDKDANGRYDQGREPWFEGRIDLSRSMSLDMKMLYADTTLAVIKEARAVSDRVVEISLSKTPVSIGDIYIRAENGTRLPVMIKELDGTRLTLITQTQDSLAYRVEIKDLADAKGNRNPLSAIGFRGSARQDTEAPAVLSSTPRNGTSVASLQPLLEVRFNEIMPAKTMRVKLVAADSNREIPLEMVKKDSRTYAFRPTQTLTNYRSHNLVIQAGTQDSAGNPLGKDHVISFLPLLKAQQP